MSNPIIETSLFISSYRKRLVEAKRLQRLQTFDSSPTRYCTSHERQYCRPSLPESRDPANAAGEQPARENASRRVHDNWIYGT
jgi:hypothetical protein